MGWVMTIAALHGSLSPVYTMQVTPCVFCSASCLPVVCHDHWCLAWLCLLFVWCRSPLFLLLLSPLSLSLSSTTLIHHHHHPHHPWSPILLSTHHPSSLPSILGHDPSSLHSKPALDSALDQIWIIATFSCSSLLVCRLLRPTSSLELLFFHVSNQKLQKQT